MFSKVLIANRGEIALRILRTLKPMGIGSVAIYSEADADTPVVREADEAFCIGPAPVKESYLQVEKLLEIAQASGVQAIHPGYGLLSENATFATACEERGIAFLGPTPAQIRDFGLKHTARELAEAAGVPLVPGSGLLANVEAAQQAAARIGYPVMLKSTAGGGGIGMRLCRHADDLAQAWGAVQRLGQRNFSNDGIFLEKYIENARHIEVQLFGDGQGTVLTLGERDCSVQRRNQKVIEETPAPALPEPIRQALHAAARRLGESVNYRSAGTVEFIYDVVEQAFYFLEVNTRLQVEHAVTEAIYGIDLVQYMVQLGCGALPPLDSLKLQPKGHSIQVRVYAENPLLDFAPSVGTITSLQLPEGVRVDGWIENGTEVSTYYDPMLAKFISHGETRNDAIAAMQQALAGTSICGIECNHRYLAAILDSEAFQSATHTTRFLDGFSYQSCALEVLDGGTQTTIQDYPGRTGYWDVGVPPSGPMDSLAFRIANRILGNPEQLPALEILMAGPTLRFHTDAWICLTGAAIEATLDGEAIGMWQPIAVAVGQTLKLGTITGHGARAYLAFAGGLEVPSYLGSASTFTLGQFGGLTGQALQSGDFLHLQAQAATAPSDFQNIAPAAIPDYPETVEIAVLYGPHGAPDFFTAADMQTFFATEWEVHFNSARTGVRLIGPKPEWARSDGGEAGLHPSNIHDTAYAVGAIDFTGDMPIILGPDGPSLGGFVCPATVATGDLWKIGQLKPGMRVRFRCIDLTGAAALESATERWVAELQRPGVAIDSVEPASPVLERLPASGGLPFAVCYRQSGDRNILIEYGPMVLDLRLRFRVHALQEELKRLHLPGLLDLTPGIRSLQVHFDSTRVKASELLPKLIDAEHALPSIADMEVPCRKVYLPLCWDDPSTQLAIRKYEQGVRKDAPWCPSNLEFIRRINGLDSIEQLKQQFFETDYLVMGLGDVYLGAPVATPVDPRKRLVTTKYNPARTWTPENAVGIGGAYLCVYGMEGPGGYQFVGRTLQMWNRFRSTAVFEPGKPWLLRFFDQIRFFPVSHAELTQIRKEFPQGRYPLKLEETTFKLADYLSFLKSHAPEISLAKRHQQEAFEAERQRWADAGLDTSETPNAGEVESVADEAALPKGCVELKAALTASVWKVHATEGDTLQTGESAFVLEAMKMEIPVKLESRVEVVQVFTSEGQTVRKGQTLAWVRPL
ncbi:MAG: urea carboxylase [Puniceicoccaceae bacterium]